MTFTSLARPAGNEKGDPGGIRVSVGRTRKENADSPLRLTVSIGADLFEEMGAPDRVSVAVGDGADHGKLQIVPLDDDTGFHVKVIRFGTALISIALPSVRRCITRAAIEHDLHEGKLTILLPTQIFRSPASGGGGDA